MGAVEVMILPTGGLATYGEGDGGTGQARLDLAIAAWLEAKTGRSGSQKTARAYSDVLQGFRAAIVAAGADLDSQPTALALAAQRWAGRGAPAATTYNQRLAILSSFYSYAVKHDLLAANPIALVERRPVQAYAAAAPLTPAEVKARLAEIPKHTVAGLRDYALLAIALHTGRRLAEIAAMVYGNVRQLNDGRVAVTFPHCKGGKVMRDTLPLAVSRSLMAYLYQLHGAALGTLEAAAPVWVSLQQLGRHARPCLDHAGNAADLREVAGYVEVSRATSHLRPRPGRYWREGAGHSDSVGPRLATDYWPLPRRPPRR